MSDRTTRVLQSPQVRASEGQKVTLRIGDKIPYATGSFGYPGAGVGGGVGGGVGYGVANTQFNFAEVGVNVDITPQVHGSDEVTLKVAVEISNVRDRVTIGGVEQPIIGQRKSETEIRLREGEVNIIGGLSQSQDTRSVSGIPGISTMPGLGKFLGSESIDKEKGELLIAMIPHIVRTPGYTPENLRGVAAGSDQTVRVSYAAREPETIPAGVDKMAPQGAAPTVIPSTPAGPVQPAPPAPVAPDQGTGPRLSFVPPALQAQVGAPVVVTLQAQDMADLFGAAPIRIKYDPKVLRLNDIASGDLLGRDGQTVTVAKDIRNDSGEATLTLSRLPGTAGVSGSGALATFSFVAVGKGSANLLVTEFGLRNSQNSPIVIAPPAVKIEVQ